MGGFARLRYLLDTHIWIWSLSDPNRLGKRVVRALQSSQNELWLSPISIWEFMVLAEKGRVVPEIKPGDWILQAFQKAPIKEATLTFEIAIESGLIDLPHQDPADRFLAATAKILNLTLVTGDERLMH